MVTPLGLKHVAVWILYKVVFDGFLFTAYFIAEPNEMHNFKNVNHNWYSFLKKKKFIHFILS
jgi:hypothetical protein